MNDGERKEIVGRFYWILQDLGEAMDKLDYYAIEERESLQKIRMYLKLVKKEELEPKIIHALESRPRENGIQSEVDDILRKFFGVDHQGNPRK